MATYLAGPSAEYLPRSRGPGYQRCHSVRFTSEHTDSSATGTDYFAHCHDHHVPNTADIYLLEAAVNDLVM